MVNLCLLFYCTFQKNPLSMSWFKKLFFYTNILLECLAQKRTFSISSWWLERIWFPWTIFIIPSKELFGQQINWTEWSARWVSSSPNSISRQIILLSHKIEKHLHSVGTRLTMSLWCKKGFYLETAIQKCFVWKHRFSWLHCHSDSATNGGNLCPRCLLLAPPTSLPSTSFTVSRTRDLIQ